MKFNLSRFLKVAPVVTLLLGGFYAAVVGIQGLPAYAVGVIIGCIAGEFFTSYTEKKL
jgi:hypothetical protein